MLRKQELYRVEDVPGEGFEVTGLWEDDIHEIRSRLVLNVFSFSISEAEIKALRVPHDICLTGLQNIKHLKGVNIGPGFTKRVNQLTGGKQGCSIAGDMVLNSIKAVIQAGSRKRPEWMDEELYDARWTEWMKKYQGICIYFAQPDLLMGEVKKCVGEPET